jgi:hypothetical protein
MPDEIGVTCRKAELEPTFFAMIAEAIRRMREPGVPEATTLRNVLQEFDDLFGRPPATGNLHVLDSAERETLVNEAFLAAELQRPKAQSGS